MNAFLLKLSDMIKGGVSGTLSRASEPSTYAGLSAIAAALMTSLGLDTEQGRVSLAVAILTGLVAIIKRDGPNWLQKAVKDAETVTETSNLSALTAFRDSLAKRPGAPPQIVTALTDAVEVLKVAKIVDANTSAATPTGN